MAAFPALPIFTDAYLSDTRDLTAAQHGAYVLLLMTAWRTSDCALPNDDKKLARWAAMDLRTWHKNKDAVMSFWRLGADQKWRQRRLTDERKYVEQMRDKNADAGKASALKKRKDIERPFNQLSTKRQPPHPLPLYQNLLTKILCSRPQKACPLASMQPRKKCGQYTLRRKA